MENGDRRWFVSHSNVPAMSAEQDFLKQAAASPEVEIIGVVGPSGVTGGRFGGAVMWTLALPLVAWRQAGLPVEHSELRVQKPVTDEELKVFQERAKSYAVVRVKARLAGLNAAGHPRALLVDFLGEDSDAELQAQAQKLQEPVTFEDRQFGTFTLDRRVDWYEAETHWMSKPVRLSFNADEPDKMGKSLATARQLWADESAWQQKIDRCALEHLLDLKNDNWLGEEETEVSPEEFAERMRIESISVQSDGSFEFWYDDGDLFWGHTIMVSGSLESGCTDAGIHG